MVCTHVLLSKCLEMLISNKSKYFTRIKSIHGFDGNRILFWISILVKSNFPIQQFDSSLNRNCFIHSAQCLCGCIGWSRNSLYDLQYVYNVPCTHIDASTHSRAHTQRERRQNARPFMMTMAKFKYDWNYPIIILTVTRQPFVERFTFIEYVYRQRYRYIMINAVGFSTFANNSVGFSTFPKIDIYICCV